MPEFDEAREQFAQRRAEDAQARRALHIAAQRLERLDRLRAEAERRQDPDAVARLDAMRDKVSGAVAGLRAERTEAAGRLALDAAAFAEFTDPVKHIKRLEDRHPILLLPLRLETRFKTVMAGRRRVAQLWVRAYPDDIAVDTFEEVLAEVEVANARTFWTDTWKAAGDDALRRAAWRSLVKSHGSGRAHWIIGQYAPTNADQEPAAAAGEHVLVVVTDAPLADAEKPDVRAFWRRVRLAADDPAERDAALAALTAAVGAPRAAEIATVYAPVNLAAPLPADGPVTVRVEFLELPDAAAVDAQRQAWMSAASTAVLPERLVALGFKDGQETLHEVGNPIPPQLSIGPDPSAPASEQIRVEDGELIVPEPLRWMTDFPTAVEQGMGFAIDLTPEQAEEGFDRLFVLGVRLSAGGEQGADDLEALIAAHQRSRKGFSLLPQGTPTNNVDEDDGSGYRFVEDADASYDHYFAQDHGDDPDDWRTMKDGRRLARGLGVDPDALRASPHYYDVDQSEARAVNEALWPATLGYFMDQMLEPIFDEDTVDTTRDWFTRFVVGRGTLPAVRVGRQPYGILTAAPLSRLRWLHDERVLFRDGKQMGFLRHLYGLLQHADTTWTDLADQVAHVGRSGADPHQTLLDVVGLHPSSVQYWQRYSQSLEQLYNQLALQGAAGAMIGALVVMAHVQSAMAVLEDLGHQPGPDDPAPELLDKLFLSDPNLLTGPVVDDMPPSETDPVHVTRDDGTNYLQWLAAAARQSHDTLRRQQGFADGRPPRALLYLMLRHALDLGFVHTAVDLHFRAGLIGAADARAARREPKFLHVQAARAEPNPWQLLYVKEAAITADPQIDVGAFIPRILELRDSYLKTQIEAIERLADAPTARLERALAEHVDCCTYRLDAWWQGLLGTQLEIMRSFGTAPAGTTVAGRSAAGVPGAAAGAARGCHLGAYGWVEELVPEDRTLRPVRLDGELAETFTADGAQPPLMEDDQNRGHIHAPSLDHAVTAAVLRNGYEVNATPAEPDALSINLTSERVRLAMGVIDGMRNGQSLGALLGYHLERGLHDRPGLFLDSVLFELRKAFPLVAGRFSTTRAAAGTPIEQLEARNVLDGLALVEHLLDRPEGDRGYPFGHTDLPALGDAERAAVDAEVDRILDIHDAVADLAMAESVYQMVRGNHDRAASTLEAYAKGNFPPTPEVVQTPRSGVTLTHRVALHLPAGLDVDDPALTTPRAKGEPAVNAWLATLLPPMDHVCCTVHFFDHGAGAVRDETVTAADLGLLPADLLYTLNRDGVQDMTALDDLIVRHVVTAHAPRPDADIEIRYRGRPAGSVSFFEIAPILDDLGALLLRSRPLRATDARLPGEAQAAEDAAAEIRDAKVERVDAMLNLRRAALAAFTGALGATLDGVDDDAAAAAAIDGIDGFIDDYVAAADALSRFGLPGAATGFAWDWRRRTFGDLVALAEGRVTRLDDRLAEFDAALAAFPAQAAGLNEEEQIDLLLRHGLLLSTDVILPPASGLAQDLHDTLLNAVRPAFVAVRDGLAAIVPAAAGVGDLFRALEAAAPALAPHDSEALEVTEQRDALVAFARTLRAKSDALLADVVARRTRAAALHAGSPEQTAAQRIEARTAALRELTCADFLVLPEFPLGAEHAAEWQAAYDTRGTLLDFLHGEGTEFPVDDWLHGVARVREKLHRAESVALLDEVLGGAGMELEPVQFPLRAGDSWLALRFPEVDPVTGDRYRIDEDKLLYTAHYADGFDAAATGHCGVLVDEWTEVMPTTQETTGLVFHHDRPDCEAPQTLLLVLPAAFTGAWAWEDLVDTLHETLDLARKRAVEPRHVDGTALARLLPATLTPVTRFPIIQALNFAFNNGVQFAATD